MVVKGKELLEVRKMGEHRVRVLKIVTKKLDVSCQN